MGKHTRSAANVRKRSLITGSVVYFYLNRAKTHNHDRVNSVRVNRNHARCYISYLDTVGGGGCVC